MRYNIEKLGENRTMNVFEQKRRNRPIDITDVAISKIKKVSLDGFSDEQEEFIRDRHRDVLVAAKTLNCDYRRNDIECGILIDLHCWEYVIIEGKMQKKGEASRVYVDGTYESKLMLDAARKNQLMFIHNHPSTGTFSAQDLKTFCRKNELYIMSAVGNDGALYMLIKQAGFDGNEVMCHYGELAEKFKSSINNATLAVKEMLKHAERYKLKYIRR